MTKLQVRMLLDLSDPLVKKTTNGDLKKKIVRILTEAIKMKVNAKESR